MKSGKFYPNACLNGHACLTCAAADMAVKCSYGTLLTAPSQDVSVSEEHRVEPPATTLPPCLTTPKNPPAFMCVYCGTTFTQKGSANRHYVQETCRKRPPATYLEQQSASKRGRGDRGEVRANTVTAATTGDSSPCFCNTTCLTLYGCVQSTLSESWRISETLL